MSLFKKKKRGQTQLPEEEYPFEEKFEKLERDSTFIGKSFNQVKRTINELIDKCSYLEEYIQAVNFLSWFSWDKLKSEPLVKEAKNKLLEELSYVQTSAVLSKIGDKDLFGYDKFSNSIGTYGYTTSCDSHSITVPYNYGTIAVDTAEKCICTHYGYVQKPVKPKHKYDDYVKAVVRKPYAFSKSTVYRVYKYLLEIIDKDKLVDKYKNI